MQFADFMACAFDQIVNVAAKARFRMGADVPLVIRAPFGAGIHGGPYHSQSPEGWFFHTPGLKLVAPATAYDAKGLFEGCHPRPQSRLLPRAQGALPPREGRGARGRIRRPDRRGAGSPGRARR